MTELNLHVKNHTGETIIDQSFADIVKTPIGKMFNAVKRGLSISPEVVPISDELVLKSNNKKPKK